MTPTTWKAGMSECSSGLLPRRDWGRTDLRPDLDRNNNLTSAVCIASDMMGKVPHVPQQDRLALLGRRTTHALSDLDALTGHLTVEGPQNQAVVVSCIENVEAGPVDGGGWWAQRMVHVPEQRRRVR
jgi:hypothetical protein